MKISYLPLLACAWCFVDGSVIPDLGIWGGTPVKIKDAPFMAILRPTNWTWWCGASIVAEKFLITAAHCIDLPKPNMTLKVTVGTDNSVVGGKDYVIEKIIVHPNYKEPDYDIAVIKLKDKLEWSDSVKSIPMADSDPEDGAMADVMGFGKKENGKYSETLLGVKVAILNRNKCQEIIATETVTDRMMCAGIEKGKGHCYADSGGPLSYQGTLVGVVSWGIDCGAEFPGVYADVASMRDFIDEVIKDHS